jgi:hypothetical protein
MIENEGRTIRRDPVDLLGIVITEIRNRVHSSRTRGFRVIIGPSDLCDREFLPYVGDAC